MTYTATITSQGQVTIPKPIRELLLSRTSADRKIIFELENDRVLVKPAVDFLSLQGSVQTRGKQYSDQAADQVVLDSYQGKK